MKKLLKKLSDKLSVDGYNPLNGFNIFLSILSGLTLGLFIVGLCRDSYWIQDIYGTIDIKLLVNLDYLFRNSYMSE